MINDQEGNTTTSDQEHIEALRLILEAEQGRTFTNEEALEIGQSLIEFFEMLAEDADNNLPITEEAEEIAAPPQALQQSQQVLLV